MSKVYKTDSTSVDATALLPVRISINKQNPKLCGINCPMIKVKYHPRRTVCVLTKSPLGMAELKGDGSLALWYRDKKCIDMFRVRASYNAIAKEVKKLLGEFEYPVPITINATTATVITTKSPPRTIPKKRKIQ